MNLESMPNLLLYTTQDKKVKVELYELGQSVFLAQDAMAKLFDTSKSSISEHISNILKEGELQADSVIREIRTTAKDGKTYKVKFYSLEMILAVGFRVRSKRGVQFRIWANEHLRSYLQKGFIIDSDRLKNPNRLVNVFLESAELRVKDKQTLTMDFWRQNVDSLLAFQGKEVLKDNGSISNAQMEQIAYEQYEKFNQKRKEENLLKAQKEDEEILESTYKALSKGK